VTKFGLDSGVLALVESDEIGFGHTALVKLSDDNWTGQQGHREARWLQDSYILLTTG